jgi:hypothetical protein
VINACLFSGVEVHTKKTQVLIGGEKFTSNKREKLVKISKLTILIFNNLFALSSLLKYFFRWKYANFLQCRMCFYNSSTATKAKKLNFMLISSKDLLNLLIHLSIIWISSFIFFFLFDQQFLFVHFMMVQKKNTCWNFTI